MARRKYIMARTPRREGDMRRLAEINYENALIENSQRTAGVADSSHKVIRLFVGKKTL